MGYRDSLLFTAVAASALIGGEASGQDRAPDTASLIDEVIVTAQRRSESVQQVPAAITAVTGEMLAKSGIDTTGALQYVVPSLQVGTYNGGGYNAGGTGLTIRGVGANVGAPTVAVSIDGVYQPRATMAGLAQVDLDRVEVLRGPQGTLYGRNANGGAVNFLSKAPTDAFEGYVLAGYAEFDEARLQGVMNLPLGERARARVLVDYQDRDDGFVRNVVPGGQDVDTIRALSGRFRLAVDLASELSLDVGLVARHSEGADTFFEVITGTSIPGANAAPGAHTTSANAPINSDRDYASARATLKWKSPLGELTSITAFQEFDETYNWDTDATNVEWIRSPVSSLNQTLTQELNLNGSTGRVDWVLGAFYMEEDTKILNQFRLGPTHPFRAFSPSLSNVGQYDTVAYAGFGDLTISASDRLRFLLGARYSRDEVTVSKLSGCPTRRGEFSFDSWTPRAGVQFDLSDQQNVYFTASRGFKAGGVNPYICAGGVFDTYEPEKITSYEAGFKSRLFDRRLTFNASAFYYDYTDLQVTQLVGLTTLVSNAAGATVKGLELEAVWAPNAHWVLNANTSFIDATYDDFLNVDALAPALGLQDLSGNRLNFTPKTSINLGVYYTTGQSARGALSARADVSYRSRVYFREFNLPQDSTPAYTVVNVSVAWDSPDERFTVRLFANNVTDEAYLTRLISASLINARLGVYGPPRQIGAELKARF